MRCVRPLKHRPKMVSIEHCKACIREAREAKAAEVIRDLTGEEE